MAQNLGGLGQTVVIVMWIESALAIFFTIARYISRTITVNRLGWDDALMGMTMAFLLLFTIFCTVAATNGLGQHFSALSRDQFSSAYQYELIGQTFGLGAVATSKLGVGLFQLRIVETAWVRWLIGFLVIVMTTTCIFEAAIDFLQCIPPDHIWDTMVPAQCWISLPQYVAFSQFLGAWTVVCDFAFAAIPWIVIWPLNMARSRRAWICTSMSWGVFAGICGIIRAVNVSQLSYRTDYTYDTVPLILWSSTETLVTIGTACIPTYRDLYIRLFKPQDLETENNYQLDSALRAETDGVTTGDCTPKQYNLRLPQCKDIESGSQLVAAEPKKEGSEHSSDREHSSEPEHSSDPPSPDQQQQPQQQSSWVSEE